MTLAQITPFVRCTSLDRQTAFSIDVDGIDAHYAAMGPALSTLTEGRVRAPFHQPYGQREFHVADENCTPVFFGEYKELS
ncbi:MAG: hypothetical protein CSA70_05470 [Rhodobacterales bacterium]|nr:MAG: hypothetical protein CSA70_05470 [Rhodobacterales bacterium]